MHSNRIPVLAKRRQECDRSMYCVCHNNTQFEFHSIPTSILNWRRFLHKPDLHRFDVISSEMTCFWCTFCVSHPQWQSQSRSYEILNNVCAITTQCTIVNIFDLSCLLDIIGHHNSEQNIMKLPLFVTNKGNIHQR